jgi:DNA-binding MarR family transcriptional regulator
VQYVPPCIAWCQIIRYKIMRYRMIFVKRMANAPVRCCFCFVFLHYSAAYPVAPVEGMSEMRRSVPIATETTSQTTASARGASVKQAFEAFDDRGRTVAWMARTVHRLYDAQAQKLLDREAISIAHWYYLRVLAERGKLNQLELSKRVGIASTTAVPALDNMEKRGLLKRIRDPKDRRKYYVCITDSGRDLVDKLLPELTGMVAASIDGILSDDMRIFWKVMHKIEKNLSETSHGNATLD